MQEREIALFILMDIFETGAYNNIILRKTLGEHSELSPKQKAFVTELVNGALRNLINIDYVIDLFSSTKTAKMKPFILNDIRLGVYQILYMDKIPVSAACNEAVKLAKKRRFGSLSGFVNGVLRSVARSKDSIEYPADRKRAVSLKYSVPEWLVDHWLEEMSIDEAEKMCAAFLKAPRLCACVNTLKTTRAELKARLFGEGIDSEEDTLFDNTLYISKTGNISQSECYKAGLFHIMDESSVLAARILAPEKNSVILDMCAAPGGKSFALAEQTEDSARIISCDIYEHKLELIRRGAERLGINSVEPLLKDACEKSDIKADYILLDAPCSGFGLLRKKPDVKYNRTAEDISSLANVQKKMLLNAVGALKPGGVLVYSTCTVSHSENIDNVNWLIDTGRVRAEDISPHIPEGIDCDTAKDGYIRLLPHASDTDGFFIARLRRVD